MALFIISTFTSEPIKMITRFHFICFWSSVLLLTIVSQGQQTVQDAGPSTTASQRSVSWELHQKLALQSQRKGIDWRPVGPRKSGGRIESIACPQNNSSTIYVGAGSGGLWKTVNNGITWNPIFENQSTCAIGDVAVAASNPNIVWVGTGEVLMARSALAGAGVFKSIDAGKTWENMGLQDTHHIGRVLIHPNRPEVVYVAAIGHRSSPNNSRGLFKTSNGGKTWQKVLFINDHTAVIDLVMDPSNPEILYTTTWQRDTDGQDHYGVNSGVYKSLNAGKSWSRLAGGLPQGDHVGRIGIDVAATNPNIVYAIVDGGRDKDGIFRSADAGITWQQINETPIPVGWDWCEIRVSPDDENTVYSIGQNSYYSTDGGRNFEKIGGTIVHMQSHPSTVLHLDTHAMWINPDNPNHVLFGNDGGLYTTYDRCQNWLHLNNFSITEIYAITHDQEQPYNIYIGTQDNAALFGPSTHRPGDGLIDPWQHVYIDRWGGGDSYFTYRDPTDPGVIYYEHQFGGMIRKNMITGQKHGIRPSAPEKEGRLRFAWMTPFFPSAHTPTTLYCGANRVFKSTNRGDNWQVISPDLTLGKDPPNTRYQAITALVESPHQSGVLFAGTDNGNVYRTRNDGKSWQAIHDGLPRYAVTNLALSPHDPDKVFVTFSGLGCDDFAPHVFRSDNAGNSWRSIAAGLPLETVHVLREDPRDSDTLYLGTDLGVYQSSQGGQNWISLRGNLPTASVQDLFIHPVQRELVIGTHGRGVFILDLSKKKKE